MFVRVCVCKYGRGAYRLRGTYTMAGIVPMLEYLTVHIRWRDDHQPCI